VSRNGKQHPARPRIEVEGSASPAEAAAIAAAIEQFLRDTAPPPAPAERRISPWTRAGLLAGTGRDRAWGDAERWGV
jgi:hypothetical protein